MNRNEFLPLSEATFYILLALSKPMHGYAAMQRIRELSGGQVWIAAGTMYGALDNLVKRRLIEPVSCAAGAPVPRRKQYVLSPLGRSVLDAEYERLKFLVDSYNVQTPERGAV